MRTISKGEAARRFGVAASMVTKYLKRGMPVTGSGRINWAAAQKWRHDNIHPELSGSWASRQREDGEQKPQGPPAAAAYRELLDSILGQRHLVPGILAEIGLTDPILLHAADDLFVALVCRFCGGLEDVAYRWDTDDIPLVDTDIAGLFQKYGLELSAEVVTAADEMVDRLYELWEAGECQ